MPQAEIAEKFSDGKMELEKAKELNYKEILQNEEVKAYLEKGNENLGILGYTDHSEKHCAIVAKRAGMILSKFGYTEHEIELAEIAGAMHDIGNVINRKNHGEYGAILACSILEKLKMPLRDRILVMSAIGNHDELMKSSEIYREVYTSQNKAGDQDGEE